MSATFRPDEFCFLNVSLGMDRMESSLSFRAKNRVASDRMIFDVSGEAEYFGMCAFLTFCFFPGMMLRLSRAAILSILVSDRIR